MSSILITKYNTRYGGRANDGTFTGPDWITSFLVGPNNRITIQGTQQPFNEWAYINGEAYPLTWNSGSGGRYLSDPVPGLRDWLRDREGQTISVTVSKEAIAPIGVDIVVPNIAYTAVIPDDPFGASWVQPDIRANLWVAVEGTYWNDLVEAFEWDEETQGPYTGPITDDELLIFSTQNEPVVVLPMFRQPTIGIDKYIGTQTNVPQSMVPAVINALDPVRSFTMGCWDWSGPQFGQALVIEYDPITGEEISRKLVGTPNYPITEHILSFMPTIKVYDENGNLINELEPDEPTDVNLRVGQTARYWVDAL